MKNCIFCKIVKGEIDSAKIWEDKQFLAILDVMPNTKGMTLVLSKKHYHSYAFDLPKGVYQDLMNVSKEVAKVLEKGLGVKRIALVTEGMGINHVHIKLYPLHDKFTEMWGKEKVYFDRYEGYLTTQIGEKVDLDNLKRLAKKIKDS
jgi:diadenosine tetraphosphate (Ap4A) HIT family hydrolase